MRLVVFALLLGVILLVRLLQVEINTQYREAENQSLATQREGLARLIDQITPYPQSTLLAGILVGEDRIPFWLKQDLKATGTIHMVVVSGQNLSILAGFLMGLIYILGRRKIFFIILICILIYSVLTGLQIPVLRAAIMTFFAFSAQFFGREAKPLWIIFLTASLMLIFNPNWLFSISFQLSFMATLGVILSPILSFKLKKVPRVIREDLAVTTSATLFTLPILAANFGQFSLIGLVVNLLVLWIIPIVMVVGALSLALALINLALGSILAVVPTVLLTYFLYLVRFFADSPLSLIFINQTPVSVWVGYYLVLFSLLWALSPGADLDQDDFSIKSKAMV